MALGSAPNFGTAAAAIAAQGMSVVALQVAFASYLQQQTTDAFRGRVMALTSMVASLASISGFAVAGPLVDSIGVRPAFTLAGALICVVSLPVLSLVWDAARAARAETESQACQQTAAPVDSVPPTTGVPMDALDGLTVLDFTSHLAGPYCTKLLADLGARVIKVERPGGDPARALPPFLGDRPGPDRSATWHYLNTNKESIVIDLKRPGSAAVVRKLMAGAQLAVTSSPPRVERELGIDYSSLASCADIPVVSITNFGHDGPYRDYRLSDTVLYAMGAEMYSHGLAHREPLKLGGTAAVLQGGAMAAVAAMGAITAYEVHGLGQLAEVPLFNVQLSNIDRRSSSILAYRFSGRVQQRPQGAGGLAGGVYPVADGHVEVTATAGNYWRRFVDMIGDDTLRHPKWENPMTAMDPAAKEEADAIVYPWMLSRTRAEVWEEARRARAMVAPIYDGTDLFLDGNFRDRGLWTEIEHAEAGKQPMLGRPYIFERTPWRIRSAAPTLGEHTDAVLREAGFSAADTGRLRAEEVVA
jgi:crotonobetainyl-CoA:carnitine CoA-transferase CaiB-like acyl-CoA transferase